MEQQPVLVRRRVKPGSEGAFESAMREFIRFALSFPKNRGINVLRQANRRGAYLASHAGAHAALSSGSARIPRTTQIGSSASATSR